MSKNMEKNEQQPAVPIDSTGLVGVWTPAEEITRYPELCSDPMNIVPLIVATEEMEKAAKGWYQQDANRWWLADSPSEWTVTHFRPWPEHPNANTPT